MTALLRYQGSSGARPCQGRSSLDRACAPAEYGSYREARTGKISQFEVSTLSGEPRKERGTWSARQGLPRTLPPYTWNELEEARRVEPDPERLDEFMSVQLSQDAHDRIARALH
jgi:hypothetical protein